MGRPSHAPLQAPRGLFTTPLIAHKETIKWLAMPGKLIARHRLVLGAQL